MPRHGSRHLLDRKSNIINSNCKLHQESFQENKNYYWLFVDFLEVYDDDLVIF